MDKNQSQGSGMFGILPPSDHGANIPGKLSSLVVIDLFAFVLEGAVRNTCSLPSFMNFDS